MNKQPEPLAKIAEPNWLECIASLDSVSVDICGLCGEPGADKYAHPIHWPGERVPDSEFVHAECEAEECGRAHAALSDRQRRCFLSSI